MQDLVPGKASSSAVGFSLSEWMRPGSEMRGFAKARDKAVQAHEEESMVPKMDIEYDRYKSWNQRQLQVSEEIMRRKSSRRAKQIVCVTLFQSTAQLGAFLHESTGTCV